MDDSVRLQETAVAVQEHRGRQALVLAGTQLGIGEGQPDFRDLAGPEEGGDELDARAEKSHVRQTFRRRGLCSAPETSALDVDAYVVFVGIAACKFQGVLPLATAKFQNYVALMPAEHLLDPMPFDRVVGEIGVSLREHLLCGWLEQAAKSLVFGEFAEFIVSHRFVCRLCRGRGRTRAD